MTISPMMPAGSPDLNAVLALVSIMLVPLAAAGLALINAGLGRSRNAAHSLLSSLCIFAVAIAAYFIVGFAWQGIAGAPGYAFTLAGKEWNWIAAGRFFFHGIAFDGTSASLIVLFQVLCVGLAALVPLGAGGGRWRLSASAISAALLAGWTYPLFAHWVWGGGWLARLGAHFSLGNGFIDVAGSGTIHAIGGLTGLCAAWILGPRRGKYGSDGSPAAIPGHNIVTVGLGCMLAVVGWLGLNSAGALLFGGVAAGTVVLVSMNTILCAVFATAAAAFFTRLRFGKPDASLCVNGCIGGLVASSAACSLLTPLGAAVTGAIAGALVTYSVELLEVRLKVDDPGGSVSVHAVCGIWGLAAVALLTAEPNGQWLAQLAGIATLIGFVLPMSYGLNWALNSFWPMRVSSEAERQGLDLHELGAGAYPEFVTHTEEYMM